MVELKVGRPNIGEQLKQALPLLAVLGLILAGWFGYNAWELWNDERRREIGRAHV